MLNMSRGTSEKYDMSYRLKLRGFKNVEQMHSVRKILNRLDVLIPGWLVDLTVSYDDEGERGYYATANCQWEYRTGAIKLYPLFWGETETEQRHIIRHELIHILMGGLLNLIIAEHTGEDETGEWTRHLEAATEDIACAFRNVTGD